MNVAVQHLQQELYATLQKAKRNYKLIGIARILSYGGALIYFLGIVVMPFFFQSDNGSFFLPDYTQNPNPSFWEQNRILIAIIPLFVLITMGSYGVAFYYKKLTEAEQHSIRRILRTMFPDAKLALSPSELSISTLLQSNFFGGLNSQYAAGNSFGTVIFETGGQKIAIRDIAVNTGKKERWIGQTQIGAFALIMQMMFKGMFSKRVENITSTFRGLFAEAKLAKKINGSVVVLPDHLERRLDYLAKNVQALKNVNGNKLVQLEDVEFERYFAVYSNDEITARYVLTPAMMLRMTELKKKYNRDIMLSFSGDQFYFAVSMPEGFLTLGNHTDTAVYDLYDNIETARSILKELRLDKGVEEKKEIVL